MSTLVALLIAGLGLLTAAGGVRGVVDPRWLTRERSSLLDKALGLVSGIPVDGARPNRFPLTPRRAKPARELTDRQIRTLAGPQAFVGLLFFGAALVQLVS